MSAPSKRVALSHLIQACKTSQSVSLIQEGNPDSEISLISDDSRKVTEETASHSVFVALQGSQTDGHQYLKSVLEKQPAAVVVVNASWNDLDLTASEHTTVIGVDDTYLALADLCNTLQGNPGQTLRMIGVTGTNGKTTVTHLIEQMLKHLNKPVGLIGTLGHKSNPTTTSTDTTYQATSHTTPMAPRLYEILGEMKDNGLDYVVMEASSHALEQHRTGACDFEVAVLTNLTQDHLDYHITMEHYFNAKALLFSELRAEQGKRSAVINLDAERAAEFVARCPKGANILTYAIDAPNAVVRAENVNFSIEGASFTVVCPEGSQKVNLKIAGEFSIYNALAAIAAGLALDIPLAKCVDAIEQVPGIRGRFEVVGEKPYVIVDYAHTPDGLENILEASRQVLPDGSKLIAVFGCGGDRDATKRPKMGHIAERLADILVVTSDNPRSEDPQQIITDVISGIQRFDAQRMHVNADRKVAIELAIDLAQPNDIIVVAGKGHEDYQILADKTIHFDDREVVQNYLKQTGRGTLPATAHA